MTFDTTLTFPGSAAWSITLNGEVSYPLIADGLAFVTTNDSSFCKRLYALDERTGSVVWGPTNPFTCGGGVFAGHAYDQGTVFTIDGYLGLLRSFNAVTGQEGWYSHLPTGYARILPRRQSTALSMWLAPEPAVSYVRWRNRTVMCYGPLA